ncbi:MAG: MCE family protein [Pedobacter sp.]|nr:MAG: MCE family protein [Pedobacter sp.]
MRQPQKRQQVKISNETKVGAIAVVTITILILGFNFLKGKKLFSSSTTLFGKYGNVQGLQNSNPVVINGLQVGTVYRISTDKDMRQIIVELNITKDINIPENSIAIIKPNPVGTTSIEIKLGDAVKNLATKDTIFTEANAGIFNDILKKVDPVLYEVRKAVTSLDSLMGNINSVIDPRAKNNIGATCFAYFICCSAAKRLSHSTRSPSPG